MEILDSPMQMDRLLSEERSREISNIIMKSIPDEGGISIRVMSFWSGELKWVRSSVNISSDRRDIFVWVLRSIGGGAGFTATNQISESALTLLAEYAVQSADSRSFPLPLDRELDRPRYVDPHTITWSDSTYNRSSFEQARIGSVLVEKVAGDGMLSAGYLESNATSLLRYDRDMYNHETYRFATQTQAQCSATIRTSDGVASGWSGESFYDIGLLNEELIVSRALEKCLSSNNPVRIEPGRYTAILEPQAVSDIVTPLVKVLDRGNPEAGRGPFAIGYDRSLAIWRSRLGLKIADSRITIEHDPSDPELGILVEPHIAPVTWIYGGVLKALSNDWQYAIDNTLDSQVFIKRESYRMSGADQELEDMIATTERGLLVSRFSGIDVIDLETVLCTGMTRDGLWLIENGRITKAVRNFRITESPLFMLNNVDMIGRPIKVFNPQASPYKVVFMPSSSLSSVIVPPLKVADFSFTSTIDAI